MPREQFLKDGERLTKANFLTLAKALKNRATREIDQNQTEVEQYFDDIERRIELDKLHLLVNILANKMSAVRSSNLVDALNFDRQELKQNAISNYKNLIRKYITDDALKQELNAYLDSAASNNNITIENLADRVRASLPEEHKTKVLKNDICFVPLNVLLRRFDEFIIILQIELSSREIEEIGEEVNSFKSKYEYGLGDNITKPLYSDQTAELIGHLNTNRQVDGRQLNDDEVRLYEEALMKANELFGEPLIDLDEMASQKNDLDKAIDHDQQKNADEILKGLGYDPEVVRSAYNLEHGSYYEIIDDKVNEFNHLKDGIEFSLSDETKAGIKEIITKLHEYGYDKEGINGEEKTKVYGLKRLYEAGLNYKKAISSENLADRIKAIAYAKEVYEAHNQAQEIFKLIDKYMPVSPNNLSFPGNVDSMRTDDLPPEYRIDYIRTSHLANLYSLANMIEEKQWDLDDFLDRPMFYLRQYYKEDYLDKVSPSKMNEGLTGDDLIFNIGRHSLTQNLDNMIIGGGRIVEGIVDSEKDKGMREQNAAMAKAFTETMFEPYNTANGFREYIAKDKHLDMILINPNITFDDLHIATFNGETLQFEEPNNERFDEISYIKERKESLSSLKDRMEISLLKYMKNEIELVTRNKEAGIMYLPSEKFVDLWQKAIAKTLILRRDEKDSPAYEELEAFVKNKQMYVHALVEEINDNGKFKDYMLVKNTNNNPPVYDNSAYNPAHFDNGNSYKNTIENYDKYVTLNKARINNQLAGFINRQKNINNNINKALQTYNSILAKYDAEVRKLYGANYRGKIDNARSDKLLDLFRQKTEAYKKFVSLRETALDGLQEEVKNGSIPISYLEDRKLQVENNVFNEIPPLFRSDKPYTMDEYVKLKHPDDFDTLSTADKETIFNTYKKTIARQEADFFARKYLISNDLTDEKTDTVEIQEFEREEVEYGELNEKVLEAQLLGVPVDVIKSNNIGQGNNKLDEMRFLRQDNKQIAEYKKFMDKNLIELIKNYNNKEEEALLPEINKTLDVFQRAALKYMLTVGYIDKASKEYKDLNEFLVDGRGYINKLIEEENKNIEQRNLKAMELQGQEFEANHQEEDELVFEDLEDKITIDMNSLGVTDEAINNYANIMAEFEAYYKDKVKTNFFKLPPEIEAEENNANNILMQEYARVKNARVQANNSVLEDEQFDVLEDYKLEVRDRIFDYFKRGLVSEDYLNERYRRLDNNDFKLPKFFTIDKMRSRDDYVKSKYLYEYNNLTKDEKNQIYNRYKDECEANRRQFILRKFMVEKGLTEFVTPTLATFEKDGNQYKPNQIDDIANLSNGNRKQNNNGIKEREEIEISEDYLSPKKKEPIKLSIFDESEEERIREKEMRNNYTFKKWNLNLLDILREKMGDEIYAEEQIEARFGFDREADSSLYWIDAKCNSLKQMLGNDIQNVFKEAADRLSPKDKPIFTKLVQENRAYAEYFPTLTKKEKEFTEKVFESLNEEKDIDTDIIITDIQANDKILNK